MIALKLIFQSLAGTGSILVCAGGGYYVMREGNEDNFYLVSSDTAASSSAPSTELWTVSTPISKPSVGTASTILTTSPLPTETKTQKNYKCFSGEANNTESDDSCYLYSLSAKPNTTIKSSEIQTFIKNPNTPSTLLNKTQAKATITANKFFLLKADKKLYTTWTFDGTKIIKLVEKTAKSSDTDKTYTTFKVHAKISSSEVEGKTSFAIVKYLKDETPAISIAANATVTCKLVNTKTATPEGCFVTAITNPSSPTDLEKIAFPSITNPTAQTEISITKDKYYLIQFETPAIHSLTELESEVIIVVSPTAGGTGDSTTTELKIQTPAFILPTSGSITEAIIIK